MMGAYSLATGLVPLSAGFWTAGWSVIGYIQIKYLMNAYLSNVFLIDEVYVTGEAND
jgi:hypothetical protein